MIGEATLNLLGKEPEGPEGGRGKVTVAPDSVVMDNLPDYSCNSCCHPPRLSDFRGRTIFYTLDKFSYKRVGFLLSA